MNDQFTDKVKELEYGHHLLKDRFSDLELQFQKQTRQMRYLKAWIAVLVLAIIACLITVLR